MKPLKVNFEKSIFALESLCDPKETVDTRGSACILLMAACDFSFLSYLSSWREILEEVNLTQKYLQTRGISLEKCTVMPKDSKLFFQSQRNGIVERAVQY